MPTPEELAETIATNATKPAQASQDGRSAAQHSLADQIELLKYLDNREAAANGRLGVGFFKTKPPGAV